MPDADQSISLSAGQEAIWLSWTLDPKQWIHIIHTPFEVDGMIDVARLRDACGRLGEAWPHLRGRVVPGPTGLRLTWADAPAIEVTEHTERLGRDEAIRAAWQRPFDLRRGPLARVDLIHGDGYHVLLVAAHHLVYDGTPALIVLDALAIAYAGQRLLPPADAARLESHANRSRELVATSAGDADREYWRKLLGAHVPGFALPTSDEATQYVGRGEVLDADLELPEEPARRAGTEVVLAVCVWGGGLSDDGQVLSLRVYCLADLRPLSASTVEEIFRSALPVDQHATIIPQLYPAIGGNASLVLAALEDLAEADSIDGWMAEVGTSFGRAVQLVFNERELSQVAQAIAVLGDRYDPATLGQVLELPLPRLGDVSDSLAALGLLGPGHGQRPWVQAAVEAYTEPETMSRMHLRVAEVLHADGASVQVVARHLLATDQPLQPWALGVLSDAAEQAVRSRAFGHAADLLSFALGWTTARDIRVELRARLLDVSWASDPSRTGKILKPLAASAGDGLLAAHRLARLVRLLAWSGRTDDAQGLLALAEGWATDPRDEVELAISKLWLAHVFPQTTVPSSADLRPELVVGMYPWLPRAQALIALLAKGNAKEAAAEAVEVLHRVLPQESDLEAGYLSLFALLSLERADQIMPWVQRFGRQVGESDLPQWRSMVAATEAVLAFWSGDFGAAALRAQAAIDVVGDGEWCVLTALPRAVLSMALTELGRHGEVAAAFVAVLPGWVTRSPYGLLYLCARSRHHLATGAPRSAADDFRAIGEILAEWGLELPGLLPWRVDLAEVYLRLGDAESAGRLAREHLDGLQAGETWSWGRAMRLLVRTLRESEGLPLLRESVALLERQGESLEQYRALEAMIRAHQEGATAQSATACSDGPTSWP